MQITPAPPQINRVVWATSTNHCGIGVTFADAPSGQKQQKRPLIQVWLLKADGTVIPQMTDGPKGMTWIMGGGIKIETAEYRFPVSARDQACAVVISIDDQFFVERLKPLTK